MARKLFHGHHGQVYKLHLKQSNLFYFTEESKEILARCADWLCPSLRDAEIVQDWIGLRPFREGGVRLGHYFMLNHSI